MPPATGSPPDIGVGRPIPGTGSAVVLGGSCQTAWFVSGDALARGDSFPGRTFFDCDPVSCAPPGVVSTGSREILRVSPPKRSHGNQMLYDGPSEVSSRCSANWSALKTNLRSGSLRGRLPRDSSKA